MISQHGRYNIWRSLKRKENLAYEYDKVMFIKESASFAFLLKRVYRTFYKWQYRALRKLEDLGEKLYKKVVAVSSADTEDVLLKNIEETVSFLNEEIIRLRLTDKTAGNFLQQYGFVLEKNIKSKVLRDDIGYIE